MMRRDTDSCSDPLRPRICSESQYCVTGIVNNITTNGDFVKPQSCFAGFNCPPGSETPEGSGPCSPGFYCPVDSPAVLCPNASYCEAGSTAPSPCKPGSYNNMTGQSACTPCAPGQVCPGYSRLQPEVCPAGSVCYSVGCATPDTRCPRGSYCLAGTRTMTRNQPGGPQLCPAGTYCLDGVKQLETIDANFETPQICKSGTYCGEGTDSQLGSGICPVGYYCPAGSASPTIASAGSYASGKGNAFQSLCPPGSYAPLTGLYVAIPLEPY